MKKTIKISTILVLICFIFILCSHKIGCSLAAHSSESVIDTDEYRFIANNIAQNIKIVAGIIASFILYLNARLLTKNK